MEDVDGHRDSSPSETVGVGRTAWSRWPLLGIHTPFAIGMMCMMGCGGDGSGGGRSGCSSGDGGSSSSSSSTEG